MLYCSLNRTIHNDTVYSFKMLLYGPMDPELLSHCVRGFHVELKLVKAVRGMQYVHNTFNIELTRNLTPSHEPFLSISVAQHPNENIRSLPL